MAEERLQKILARAGYGSRRSCEELITSGRVLVNGKKPELGSKADPAKDQIEVDRSRIPQAAPMVYLAYSKPRFMLCDKALGDERRTVFEAVPGGNELSIVGRLDFESEGLVLLTNDGELVNKLTHPRYEHEKEYKVLLASRPDVKQLDAWRRGIILEDGHRTSPAKVEIETPLGKGAWLRIVMKEGHKRQIRETAKLLGLFVVRILRVRIGNLMLGNMKPGEWRELTPFEVSSLRTLNNRNQKSDGAKSPGRRRTYAKRSDDKKPEDRNSDNKRTTVRKTGEHKPSERKTNTTRTYDKKK
jgi:23S rRNA pseudouridine2605 synthase